jgi:hypothetical protein
MSADKQQSFRVAPEVKTNFGTYAAAIGMSDSELARVLIGRELRHRQLARHVSEGREVVCGSSGDTKITAHFFSVGNRTEFSAYAKACGVQPGKVGAWIIERELAERWLERAVLEPPTNDR